MNSDEIKAAWAIKITTYEQFAATLTLTRPYSAPLQTANFSEFAPQSCSNVSSDVTADDTWFLRRELSREAVGVYPEPSNVLLWMRANGCRQFFPHVSVNDPTMVAFTPDRQSGLADRQVQTTMGKLLRKFFLVLTDKEVARLEACHRAEMDGTFEMATTSEAIQAAFAVVGDSSCMRYDKSHWGLNDHHPSAVYCAPGMGLAVTRNMNGDVNARSVIWTNPDNPTDKRYVRIYGDQALKRKLERAGYRMAGLVGAKLAALKDSAYPDAYVMPWVDPAGGMYNTAPDRSLDSCTVIKYKGEDFLRLVSDDEQQQFRNAGLPTSGVRQQSGRITITEIDRDTLVYTCAITGQVQDRITTRTVKWINTAGASGQASHHAAFNTIANLQTLQRATSDGIIETHYCTAETQAKFSVPGFPTVYNDEATRNYAGISELNAATYGEHQYHRSGDVFTVPGLGCIKRADAMRVFDEVGEERYEHVRSVKVLRKAGYVSTAVIGRIKAMSHTSNPALVTTIGGRKVLVGHYSVTQLHDGRWDYAANTIVGSYLGRTIVTVKHQPLEDVRLTAEYLEGVIGPRMRFCNTLGGLRSHTLGLLANTVASPSGRYYPTYYMESGALAERSSYRAVTLEQAEAAVTHVAGLSADLDQLGDVVGRYATSAAMFWAHHSRMILDMYHAEVAKRALEEAEANAVEAPARLGEPLAATAGLTSALNDERFAIVA